MHSQILLTFITLGSAFNAKPHLMLVSLLVPDLYSHNGRSESEQKYLH